MKTVLAVDFGGTQTRAAVVNEQGGLLSRARADTPTHAGPEACIAVLLETIRKALRDAPETAPQIVGVCAPGPLDPHTGVLYSTPNMTGWVNVPLTQRLSDALGLPCFAGNDANLSALGEWKFGAGRGCTDIVYLTVSTGIGSGVISGGRLIDGKHGLAVEAGHMLLEPNGPRCGCGGQGCLEAFSSGPSIARAMEARLALGEPSALSERRGQVTGRMVAEAAQAGDRLAAEVFLRAATYLGLGCATLINLFNPEKIILGGGVTNAGDLLFGPVRATAFRRCMPELGRGVEIVPAALRENVGLLGAAAYVLERA